MYSVGHSCREVKQIYLYVGYNIRHDGFKYALGLVLRHLSCLGIVGTIGNKKAVRIEWSISIHIHPQERCGWFATIAEAVGRGHRVDRCIGAEGANRPILQFFMHPMVKVDLHPRLAFWWWGKMEGVRKLVRKLGLNFDKLYQCRYSSSTVQTRIREYIGPWKWFQYIFVWGHENALGSRISWWEADIQ